MGLKTILSEPLMVTGVGATECETLRQVRADFFSTGTTMEDLRHPGTEASCRDRLKMCRKTPAS